MHTDTIGHVAALLRKQERAFTNEGAPPPGVVGADLPTVRLSACVPPAACQGVDDLPAKRALVDALERCCKVAHLERDAQVTCAQEAQFRLACSNMDAAANTRLRSSVNL